MRPLSLMIWLAFIGRSLYWGEWMVAAVVIWLLVHELRQEDELTELRDRFRALARRSRLDAGSGDGNGGASPKRG